MNRNPLVQWSIPIATFILLTVFLPAAVSSHCDTMDGPVITAAKKALETGNVNLVLIWVQEKDAAQIKDAFQKTLAVRHLGPDARTLADMYFFETLVRIHRAGEGVAYTGIKPSGAEVEPGIAAADKAIETGSSDEMLRHLDDAIHLGIKKQYEKLMAKRDFNPENVEAGREYVKAYVEFIHGIEGLFNAASTPARGHYHEEAEPGAERESR